MSIDHPTLKLFAGSMATCLAAGLPASRALELSGTRTPSRRLRAIVDAAAKHCAEGLTISEALAPAAKNFPRHFLPVIHAGEISGRQAEAFLLLSQHCRRIGSALQAVRNAWLYPVICVVFGWIVREGIYVYFGKYAAAWQFAETTFGPALLLVLAGWWLRNLPPVKKAFDFIRMQIPFLRETEIRQGLVLFFSTFQMVCEAGGLDMVYMFDLALATVGNDALRQDLLKARPILAAHGTVGDAFNEPEMIEDDAKNMITTGSLTGQLDQSLAWIVQQAAWRLEISLQVFNRIFQRLVVFSVAMSIVETLLVCLR